MYADINTLYMFTYKCRHISLDRLRGSLLSTRTIYEVFHELSHELYHHNITLSSHFQKLYDMYDWIHSAAHFYQAAQYTNSFTNTLTNSIITMQTYKCWHINADIYCWLHSAAHSYQATQHDELHHKLEDLSMSNFTIWLSRTVWHMWLNVWCCSLLSSCTIYELCWRTLYLNISNCRISFLQTRHIWQLNASRGSLLWSRTIYELCWRTLSSKYQQLYHDIFTNSTYMAECIARHTFIKPHKIRTFPWILSRTLSS